MDPFRRYPYATYTSQWGFNGLVIRFEHEVYPTLPSLRVMDYKATLMVLVLVSSVLAGCTGGDTDGGGNDEIDSEALEDLFNQYFEDFVNNTTITVINNYHNNTTYVVDENYYSTFNEYNNTTYMDGGEVNNFVTDNSNITYGFGQGVSGSLGSTGMLFFVHLEWDALDMFPGYFVPGDRNNSFEVTWTYWDYPTNQERTDTFEFDCTEYYIFETVSANNNSYYWGTYWESSEPYYDAWDNEYNDTIADILQNFAWDTQVQSTCDDDYTPSGFITNAYNSYFFNFLNITIPEGFALVYQQHSFDTWNNYCSPCDIENYLSVSEGTNIQYTDDYLRTDYLHLYGGWDDITIEISMTPSISGSYAVWPDSSYEYTLYYQLVPVAPHTE